MTTEIIWTEEGLERLRKAVMDTPLTVSHTIKAAFHLLDDDYFSPRASDPVMRAAVFHEIMRDLAIYLDAAFDDWKVERLPKLLEMANEVKVCERCAGDGYLEYDLDNNPQCDLCRGSGVLAHEIGE